jgi:hypothetical protein
MHFIPFHAALLVEGTVFLLSVFLFRGTIELRDVLRLGHMNRQRRHEATHNFKNSTYMKVKLKQSMRSGLE